VIGSVAPPAFGGGAFHFLVSYDLRRGNNDSITFVCLPRFQALESLCDPDLHRPSTVSLFSWDIAGFWQSDGGRGLRSPVKAGFDHDLKTT